MVTSADPGRGLERGFERWARPGGGGPLPVVLRPFGQLLYLFRFLIPVPQLGTGTGRSPGTPGCTVGASAPAGQHVDSGPSEDQRLGS